MSWPILNECEHFIDWSFYQNYGLPLQQPFDVDIFCATHPEVDGAVLRFCWPNGSVDKHYAHYYDGFKRNGKKVMGYGWGNGKKSVAAVMEDWRKALGDRIPVFMFKDWEETNVFEGMTPGQITTCIQNTEKEAKIAFPEAGHGNYSRANWLDDHVIPGDWVHEMFWWLAHWPYPPPDFTDQAKTFAELDAMLPIDNDFTPYRGKYVKIRKENVVGWQASSQLKIVPKGSSDGGYFLKSFLRQYFDSKPPPAPGECPDWVAADIRSSANAIQEEIKLLYALADKVESLHG